MNICPHILTTPELSWASVPPAHSGQPLPLHTPYLCSTMDAVRAKGNKVVTCSLTSYKKALLLRVAWVPLEMEGW